MTEGTSGKTFPSINPATGETLAEICESSLEEAGIPRGAANLLLGPGGTIGNELAASEDVDMIAFTGSTVVGQSIMRQAAGNVKKIGLELGGKSPNVIFADADLEGAVEWAMIGIFMNQGPSAPPEAGFW